MWWSAEPSIACIIQGDPVNGIVAGSAQIRSISADTGGRGRFTWKAPLEPGTYELVTGCAPALSSLCAAPDADIVSVDT